MKNLANREFALFSLVAASDEILKKNGGKNDIYTNSIN